MFMAQGVQSLDNFPECNVEIFINNDHIEVFLVFSLEKGTLFDGADQIVILAEIQCVRFAVVLDNTKQHWSTWMTKYDDMAY